MRNPDKPDGWYCPGTSKQTGNLCELRAGQGTPHFEWGLCKHHGGCTANGIKNAEMLMAEAAVVTYGLPVDTDPHTALLDELKRTNGHVLWLEALVGKLPHDAQGKSGLKQYQHTEDGGTIERPAIWIELLHRERKMLREVAKACADANVEERRLQLAERDADELVSRFRRFALALGLDLGSDEVRAAFRLALTTGDVVEGSIAA